MFIGHIDWPILTQSFDARRNGDHTLQTSLARLMTQLGCAAIAFLAVSLGFDQRAHAQSCDIGSCPAVKVYGDGEDAICRAWATEAVGQQLENEQRSCGETSDDWHLDIKRHYRICLGLSPLDREQFSENRRKRMESCRTVPKKTETKSTNDDGVANSQGQTPEWDEYCRKSYMVDALKVARTAKEWKCADIDPEFHLSKQRHYDFCVREAPNGAGDYPLHDLIGERQEKIKTCQQKAAVKKPISREVMIRRRACSKYSDIFLNAMLENTRLNCDFSGDDWHTNWNKHYLNCTTLDRSKRLRAINDRQAELRSCRAKVFPEHQLNTDSDASDKDTAEKSKPSEAVRKACDVYAKEASAHQAANTQLNCGLSGPLWTIKEETHFEACVSGRADYAFRSNMSRDSKLRQCTDVRLCQNPTRAKTQYCQDLTGLVPPGSTSTQE